MAPGERDSKTRFPSFWDWNLGSGRSGSAPGAAPRCSFHLLPPPPPPARLLRKPERTGWGGITSRGCKGTRAADARQRTPERHGAQTPSLQAARRHSPAAPPCPPQPSPPHPTPAQPAAGGQCRYEEKASIIPPANRHTPDLPYCAPSIEMQTSRVRRPQSARATQSRGTARAGAGLGPAAPSGRDSAPTEASPALTCRLEGAVARSLKA